MAAQTGQSDDEKRSRLLSLIGNLIELVVTNKRVAVQMCQLLQLVKDDPSWYDKVFANALPTSEDIQRQLNEWQKLYTEVFGLKNVDFSQLHIPTPPPGFARLLVICTDLKLSQIFQALSEKMPTWTSYDDLDTIMSKANRPTTQFYAIWVRDRVEADEELKNLSANQIQEQKIDTLNLQERLLYELKYFLETDQHLDTANITLCASSRDDVDCVPGVCWGDDGLRVYWCDPASAFGNLRSRQVVS